MPILKRLLSYCLALSLFAVAGSAHAEKTAVVDSERAAMATEEGLRAQATLKKVFDARQQELDRKRNALQKEGEALTAKRSKLTDDAYAKLAEELQKRGAILQQNFIENDRELARKRTELTSGILGKLSKIVADLAKKEGYDLVVEKQTVAYAREGLDLTDRVIQLYNQVAAAAAPPAVKK